MVYILVCILYTKAVQPQNHVGCSELSAVIDIVKEKDSWGPQKSISAVAKCRLLIN